MKKYFDILGLKEDCEQELIKAAYKTLIHKYHPDKWKKNKDFARERFIKIKNAYTILSNQEKRTTDKKQNNKEDNRNFEYKDSKSTKNYLIILFFILIIIILLCLFKFINENFHLFNNQNYRPMFQNHQFSSNKQKFCFKSTCIDKIKVKADIQKNENESIKFLYGDLDETRKTLHTFFIKEKQCFKCKD